MTAPSAFARELGLRYPIVQGPMNGASPPALAVAVSNAGALGSCAAALFSPAVILERVQQIRAQTAAPFNINLFLLDEQHPDLAELKRAQHLLRPFREALGLSEPPIPPNLPKTTVTRSRPCWRLRRRWPASPSACCRAPRLRSSRRPARG